jgi:hypothetical protein
MPFAAATLRNSTRSGNRAVYGGGIAVGVCAFGCIGADALLSTVTITNTPVIVRRTT